jgi:hypothetical protein
MARVGLVVTDSRFLMMSRVPEPAGKNAHVEPLQPDCVAFAIIDRTGVRGCSPVGAAPEGQWGAKGG